MRQAQPAAPHSIPAPGDAPGASPLPADPGDVGTGSGTQARAGAPEEVHGTSGDTAGSTAGSTPGSTVGNAPAGAGRGIVPVLAFAGISVAVMQTLLVPVVAKLPALLDTATSDAAWVITATLLSGAVATPIMGRLGDLYGKRRFVLVSLGLMVIGSLLCGVTSSLVPMVAGRALQGFAMGAIPLGISIMRDELPPERLGSAMAFMSSSLGVGGALGMPLAAYVAQHTDWHALFFGAAGLGAAAMLLVLVSVPESVQRAHGRFDVLGALGLSAGLVALLLAVSKGSDWGWGSGTTLGLFGAAVAIFLVWGLLELRLADPLVDLRTTARRQVLLTNLASITVGLAFYAVTLVLPQLIQLPAATGYGLGQSMLVAGVCVAPMGLAMMLVSSLSARISAARGPKVSLMTGQVVLAAAYLAGTGLMGAVWQVVVTTVLIGIGIGIAYSAMPALIIGAVDPSESGAANGLNTLMRSIGTSTSSAVIGVVLAHMTQRSGGHQVPQLAGFRVSFLIAAGAALLGLLIAAFLPGGGGAGRRRGRHAAPRGARARAVPRTSAVAVPEAQPAYAGRTLSGDPGAAQAAPPPAGAATPSAPAISSEPTNPDGSSEPTDPDGSSEPSDPCEPGEHTPAVVSVRGTVRGTDGAPLPGALVTLLSHGGRRLDRVRTGGDGTYRLRTGYDGDCVVLASAASCLPEARNVAVPSPASRAQAPGQPPSAQRDLVGLRDFTLRPAASVRGAVRGSGGRALPGVRVTLLDDTGRVIGADDSGPDGGYLFSGVPEGAYTLVARAGSGDRAGAPGDGGDGSASASGAGGGVVAVSVMVDGRGVVQRDLRVGDGRGSYGSCDSHGARGS
jgi:MFS family permease